LRKCIKIESYQFSYITSPKNLHQKDFFLSLQKENNAKYEHFIISANFPAFLKRKNTYEGIKVMTLT